MGFKHQRRVEFRDTDAAGIAHFSVYYAWMEQAEHAALRSLGLSVLPRAQPVHATEASLEAVAQESSDECRVTWPRVSAQCEFFRPLHFEDEVDIHVTIAKIGQKSVTYQFEFASQGHRVAQGQITAVCCRIDDGKLHSTLIPPSISARLQTLVA